MILNMDDISLIAIARCVPVLVVTLNNAIILYASSQANAMFGYLDGELIGYDLHRLISPEKRDRHRQHFKDYSADPTIRFIGTEKLIQFEGYTLKEKIFPAAIGLYPTFIAGQRAVVATIIRLTNG